MIMDADQPISHTAEGADLSHHRSTNKAIWLKDEVSISLPCIVHTEPISYLFQRWSVNGVQATFLVSKQLPFEVLEDLMPNAVSKGYAFQMEMMIRARRLKHTIVEFIGSPKKERNCKVMKLRLCVRREINRVIHPDNFNNFVTQFSTAFVRSVETEPKGGTDPQDIFATAKPYSDVPKPRGIPFFGTVPNYIFNGGGKYLHDYVQRRHEQLGPIYREKYSTEPFEVLFIGDIEGSRDVYRNERKTPLSFVIGGEELFMKLSGVKRGLLFSQGQEWLHLRRPMNHLLLKRKDYFDNFDLTEKVIQQHLKEWANPNSEEVKVNDLRVKVDDLGVKVNQVGVCTFGAFAFGDYFETHRKEIESDAEGFYQLTKDYWEGNMAMQIIPPFWAHKLKLPLWSKFESAITKMLAIGNCWTKMAIQDLKNPLTPNFKKGFLHIMLSEYNEEETDSARRVFADFIAALESETTMIQWILYIMGRHPSAQEKLFQELSDTCKGQRSLTYQSTDGMPYLNACIKESLRMFPSNCFTVRILPEDSLVKGYRVPAGTIAAVALMSVQRDPKIFPAPNKFWPERWFRSSETLDSLGSEVGKPLGVVGCQPYLPFAWGSARGCIFRRISVRRMSLFLAEMIRLYSFTTDEVKPIMRSLMIPDRDIGLTLTKRTNNLNLFNLS